MARSIPAVRSGTLTLVADGAEVHLIPLDSPAWWEWLALDGTTRFVFEAGPLRFNAHRKQRQGESYWYTARRREGRLHEVALSTAAALTQERLEQAAARLAYPAEPVAGAPQQREDIGPSASPQPVQILATKLFIPHPRPTLVPRPRLVARLEAGLRGPVTVLAAPAGWGKTTVMSAWRAEAAACGSGARPMAWVSLDAGDNDPVRFWTYVLTALNMVQPGSGDDALALLHAPQPPPIESVLTPLLNALAAAPEDVILALDDYHVIEAGAVHTAVAFVLDHLPPRLHVAISTREDPPLPLSRLRAQGGVTELRAADLRFTPEETAAFLAAALGVALPTEAIAALEARSEGWIAGLQLAALSVQGRSREQIAAFLAALTRSNRYIADYLVEEVLARQPAAIQTFLERTAVLDRFCAPLCERLLTSDDLAANDSRGGSPASAGQFGPIAAPQRPMAQTLLEQVERANLFLVPLDDERRWFRYHHLFADAVRAQLRQRDPGRYAELYRRASAWFEEQDLIEEAVEHALAAADFARAATLLEQRAGELAVRAGRFETALGWLGALPEAKRVCPAHWDALARGHGKAGETPCTIRSVTEMGQKAPGFSREMNGPLSLHTVLFCGML